MTLAAPGRLQLTEDATLKQIQFLNIHFFQLWAKDEDEEGFSALFQPGFFGYTAT